jgi:carbonyl reductase 1
VSKALINAMTQVLAEENKEVLINCCCVGWCDTDMGGLIGGRPTKTAEEGARVPLNIAFGDIGGVSGKYWENESVSGKGPGKVSDWK